MKLISLALFAFTFLTGLAECDGQPTEASTTASGPQLNLVQDNDVISIAAYQATRPDLKDAASAVFAGGCFRCTEASFERIIGVLDVVSGYSDGDGKKTDYKEVSYGRTDYVEAIYVFYDPEVISYSKLLEIFFVAHDPTTLNRQGPDSGPQYRSGIYFQTPEQAAMAKAYIAKLDASGAFRSPIVTEVKPYDHFWLAEGYHQNYYVLNPNQSYIVGVSRPKVEKVMKTFSSLVKPEYKK